MPFTNYGFSAELLRGIKELGFHNPTPIQEQAIPPAVEGKDVLACAMTGSGKSAAFGLPLIHRLGKAKGVTRALILTPTRELAAQVDEHLNALAVHTTVSSAAIYGGVGMGAQEHALRRGTDVIVATPGRLLDHMRYKYSNFKNIEVLVLDEADRMLDMGFLPDIHRILKYLPAKRQTLFFSATMPNEIAKLSREMLHDPFTISVERQSAPAAGITQAAYPVAQHLKPVLLTELMKRGLIRSVIVFTRTKARANRLADYLVRMGVSSGRIHGDRSQSQRTETMRRFKEGKFAVLVATDIAARGIDVESLSHVVNFDIPPTHEDYIHRVGRTGRNQSAGDAFAFVSPEEEGALRSIERAIGNRMPRVTLPDFDYEAGRPAVPEAAKFRGDRDGGGRGRSSSPKPYTRFGANRGGQGASKGRGTHEGQRPQNRPADDRARPARAQVVGSGIRIDTAKRSTATRPADDRFARAAATNNRQALRGADATRGAQAGSERTSFSRPQREGGSSFGAGKRKTFGGRNSR
ncbi:MAG: DEAD/DEAH box helicase [Vicinamibacteria bacterium]|nr:DEAD/DEAH box helicase [Vicinamibacteria bacterium]